MRPVIKVWGLPSEMRLPDHQLELEKLHQEIVLVAKQIKRLKVRSEADILVWFPADLMEYGLGKDFLIEVSGGVENLNRAELNILGVCLNDAVSRFFLKARFECQLPAEGHKFISVCKI